MKHIAEILSNFLRPKGRSRVLVGFHRLGVVLGASFLVGAIVLAALQWRYPTGPVMMDLPEGTLSYGFDQDELDEAAKQILDEQRRQGFNVPDSLIVVGLPHGKVQRENVDWTKFQLPDGREIGIASANPKKLGEIALRFLLAERRANSDFTDKDEPITIDGVRVTFLDQWVPKWAASRPWLRKQRDWTWPVLAFCLGVVAYVLMRSLGWIIDGFVGAYSRDEN